jgi:hypothetical protein
MNDRSTGQIVGARLEPRKVKKTALTADVGPQPYKVEANKIKKQAPTGPILGAGPQPCKVEPNNKKKQPTNQPTRE